MSPYLAGEQPRETQRGLGAGPQYPVAMIILTCTDTARPRRDHDH
jgi:hypothetical protein